MKKSHIIRIIATSFILINTALSITGCSKKESLSDSTPSETCPTELPTSERPTPTAREELLAMLGIELPTDATIENYYQGWEQPTEFIEIQYFAVKVIISTAEMPDFEQQIISVFGEPGSDFTKGIISEYTAITDPFINNHPPGLSIDIKKVDRVYFWYGTGVPLKQEEKPFVTRCVYAFVMQEEDGKRAVYFSYGA